MDAIYLNSQKFHPAVATKLYRDKTYTVLPEDQPG